MIRISHSFQQQIMGLLTHFILKNESRVALFLNILYLIIICELKRVACLYYKYSEAKMSQSSWRSSEVKVKQMWASEGSLSCVIVGFSENLLHLSLVSSQMWTSIDAQIWKHEINRMFLIFKNSELLTLSSADLSLGIKILHSISFLYYPNFIIN